MLTKIQGLVIRSVKYGETSLIFDMYTLQFGLASFIVNGARKPKSRLPASLFQLMNWLDVIAYLKDPHSLNRIKEAQLSSHYLNIPFDLHRSSVALFMTEIVQKTIRENEVNQAFYAFLQNAYAFLDQSDQPIANLHIVFLIQLSGFLGFRPNGEWSEETPYFHLVRGQYVPVSHPLYTLENQVSSVISEYLRHTIETAHEVKVSREMRQKVLNDLISFFRYHLDRLPEIHTHKILAEVFH